MKQAVSASPFEDFWSFTGLFSLFRAWCSTFTAYFILFELCVFGVLKLKKLEMILRGILKSHTTSFKFIPGIT